MLSLVTDRVAGSEYTPTDLNRVGDAVQEIADLLNGYGYAVTVNPKTDWAHTDVESGRPNVTDMTAYLADLNALKSAFYGTQAIPSSMNNITYTDANNIEKLLLELEGYINNMVAAFQFCGVAVCGTEVIL